MSDFDRELFIVVPLAIGLIILGLLGLLLRGMAPSWRIAVAGGFAAGVYGSLGSVFLPDHGITYALVTLAPTLFLVTLIRSGAIGFLVRQFHKPLIRAVSLVGLGFLALVGSHLRHEWNSDVATEQDTNFLSLFSQPQEQVELTDLRATTDRGFPIPLNRCTSPRSHEETAAYERNAFASFPFTDRALRRQSATDDCNCHGWVFAGGRYVVRGASVPKILEDNGYVLVTTASCGDLTVYRNPNGEIIHTAIVRYVAKGRPPMVEGKWGWMGVYQHAADECVYGTNYTFYRSSRDGDLLHGVDGNSAPVRFTGAE